MLNDAGNPTTAIKGIISETIHDGEEYIAKLVETKVPDDGETKFMITTTDNEASYVYLTNYVAQKYNIMCNERRPITEDDKLNIGLELAAYIRHNGEVGILNSRFFRMEKLAEILPDDISLSLEQISDNTHYKKLTVKRNNFTR
jgi:hypothetical protein